MNSFRGLYTFANVCSMYNIDQSILKQDIGENFVYNVDVKEFDGTWLITEEALMRKFGFVPLFDNITNEGELL